MTHRVCHCTSCRAPIIFFDTRNGRQMPVDAATVRPEDTRLDMTHMISHFATCTNPARHRKRDHP
jgi:hypothetical protein